MHLVQENHNVTTFFWYIITFPLLRELFIQEIKANLKKGKLTSHTSYNLDANDKSQF